MPRRSATPPARTPALPGLLRAGDLADRGLPRTWLTAMLREGEVTRVARGVYRRRVAPFTELETVATVSKRVPGAIVCLLTALAVHHLGTQLPRHVWIAVDRKARLPRISDLPVRIVRFAGRAGRDGIENMKVLGMTVRITSPARTVVDCFRYRHKIGMEVALDALQSYLRSRKGSVDTLVRTAESCRIGTVMKPYIQALLA